MWRQIFETSVVSFAPSSASWQALGSSAGALRAFKESLWRKESENPHTAGFKGRALVEGLL